MCSAMVLPSVWHGTYISLKQIGYTGYIQERYNQTFQTRVIGVA